jgi:hypothetical protein
LFKGRIPVGYQKGAIGNGLTAEPDWRMFDLIRMELVYVESKFGTAGLSAAQRRAKSALDNFFVDKWTYDWLKSAASAFGSDVGYTAASPGK